MKQIAQTGFFSLSRFIALSLSAVLFSTSIQAAPKLMVLDRVVAIVNNEAIPESELDSQMKLLMLRLKQSETTPPPESQLRKQLLDKLVVEKLQLQKAKEARLDVKEANLNQALADMASRDHLTVAELQKFIEEEGIDFSKFRENIRNEILISKLQQREISPNIQISPMEIEQFLSSSAGQDQTGAEYQLGHILIALPETPTASDIANAQKQAEKIMQKLKAGANFSQTAISESNGTQALNGGNLGWKKSAEIPSLFSKIIPTLKIGDLYGPLQNEGGFHIIKLLNKRIGEQATTEVAAVKKTHVRQILIRPSNKLSDTEAKAFLTKLRNQALAGEDFSKLASKYSEEPHSAKRGGDLGWVSKTSALPSFIENITSLRPGEISQPFKTDTGWHLVQVIEHRTEHILPEAVKTKATDLLFQRKFEEQLVPWLRRIRDESEVQIFLKGE